ncbi:C-type lectin domain family 10 member A [Drosophila biarmipes]|uniref:C-type lectin domain family 10 member A n=1 Tax=Drosophila biarmipes TaxID=125945 RepID=UPI0007E846E1|nr:C-type lectin domain family 10 member A [Drosophila biarmipes]
MYKLTPILVISLIAVHLNGSLAGPGDIQSPRRQSQDLETSCSAFFFSRLRPVMDLLAEHQESVNQTRAEQREMQIQLASVQEAITSVKASLASMQTQMDTDLSALKETQQAEARDKRWQGIEESLKDTISSTLQSVQINLEGQLKNIMHNFRLSMNYRKINSKYFYISDTEKTWSDAEKYCVDKGGHLATFESEEELIAISSMLNRGSRYWLGVSDKDKWGEFVSVASGKKVSYLKWSPGEPDYWNELMHCVVLFEGAMRMNECNHSRPIICQADDM